MRRAMAPAAGFALVAAACGSDSDESSDTAALDATESAPEPEPEPPPTDPPESTTTTEPPPPLNVIGLIPLPGTQLDFSARVVPDPSLVWSLYEGSGGIVVENVGGPLPPGCHGTSFFDPATFDLLQVDGKDAHAYRGTDDAACGNMQQDLEEGVVNGDASAVIDVAAIQFDFGALPTLPFDVSTQVVDPGGQDGIFRSSDPDATLAANDTAGATHVVGASGLFEIDAETGFLRRVGQPDTAPGPGCEDSTLCLRNGRMQVDTVNAEGSAGSVLTADDQTGLLFFLSPDNWEVLVEVVDGCAINDHFWVFAAAATDVEYDLTVTDTATGETRSYTNPLGQFGEPITDTEAFATCP